MDSLGKNRVIITKALFEDTLNAILSGWLAPSVPQYKPQKGEMRMKLKSKDIALVSILAATYAVTSYFPISVYIGGEALITANVMILPLIAYVLDFPCAVLTAFIGALAMYFTNTSIAPIYGPFTLFIPVLGVFFGALTKKNSVVAIPWIAFGAISYYLYSNGTPFYLSLYIFEITVNLLTLKFKKFGIVNCCVSTTISELVSMDLGNIFLMEFPGSLWAIILPLAIYERTVAVIGSLILIRGFRRVTKS